MAEWQTQRIQNTREPGASRAVEQDAPRDPAATMQDEEGPDELPPRSAAASAPTDGELETAIVNALALGLKATAEALTVQLRARQAGVVDLAAERTRRAAR